VTPKQTFQEGPGLIQSVDKILVTQLLWGGLKSQQLGIKKF